MTTPDFKQILTYEPSNGKLYWAQNVGAKSRIVSEAGTKDIYGYTVVRYKSVGYKAHRIVWLMKTGQWPGTPLDHVNQDKSDNRYCNLRLCVNSVNQMNVTPPNKNGVSGYRGVSWFSQYKKWKAAVTHRGKHIFLGHFDDAAEASKVYEAKKLELMGGLL